MAECTKIKSTWSPNEASVNLTRLNLLGSVDFVQESLAVRAQTDDTLDKNTIFSNRKHF